MGETSTDAAANDGVPAATKDRFVCPHPNCGTFAFQTLSSIFWQISDNGHDWIPDWKVHRCTACLEPVFWKVSDVGEEMIYPHAVVGQAPSGDMPEEVCTVYEEARRVAGVSPRSAAALLRLALQILIDRLEPGSGAINLKIGKLVEKGLHAKTQQAMDVLRVVGNNAVHPGQIDLSDDPALLPGLFTLLNVVVDQMISMPSHASNLFNSLPQHARDQISRRDGTAATDSRTSGHASGG